MPWKESCGKFGGDGWMIREEAKNELYDESLYIV